MLTAMKIQDLSFGEYWKVTSSPHFLCLEKKLSGNVMRLHIVVSMRQGEQKRPGGTLHGWPSSGSRERRQQERRRRREKVC